MSDNGRIVETKPIVSTVIPTTEAIVARTREPSRPPHDEGANRILQRLSPRRRHWPEVTAYDERAGELERRVAALNEEIAAREAARSARWRRSVPGPKSTRSQRSSGHGGRS